MNPAIFELFNNENLSKPLRILKSIGKGSLICSLIAAGIIQLNHGKMGGTPLLDFARDVIAWGFILATICFATISLVSLGKTDKNNTTQAILRTLRKIFLYMFLPAIIITLILLLILGFPK